MSNSQALCTVFIAATRKRVFSALTDPTESALYWQGLRVESTWKPGAPIYYRTTSDQIFIKGQIICCEAPSVLSFTCGLWELGMLMMERASRITFQLTSIGAVTKLTVTHDDFEADSKALEEMARVWPGVLSNIKSVIETGHTQPVDREYAI